MCVCVCVCVCVCEPIAEIYTMPLPENATIIHYLHINFMYITQLNKVIKIHLHVPMQVLIMTYMYMYIHIQKAISKEGDPLGGTLHVRTSQSWQRYRRTCLSCLLHNTYTMYM